jgi:hypothetical protein
MGYESEYTAPVVVEQSDGMVKHLEDKLRESNKKVQSETRI